MYMHCDVAEILVTGTVKLLLDHVLVGEKMLQNVWLCQPSNLLLEYDDHQYFNRTTSMFNDELEIDARCLFDIRCFIGTCWLFPKPNWFIFSDN